MPGRHDENVVLSRGDALLQIERAVKMALILVPGCLLELRHQLLEGLLGCLVVPTLHLGGVGDAGEQQGAGAAISEAVFMTVLASVCGFCMSGYALIELREPNFDPGARQGNALGRRLR